MALKLSLKNLLWKNGRDGFYIGDMIKMTLQRLWKRLFRLCEHEWFKGQCKKCFKFHPLAQELNNIKALMLEQHRLGVSKIPFLSSLGNFKEKP